jgi:threonine/homoserine/homoserine lactone efflux protein
MDATPLSYFLQAAAIGVGAALSPGPFQSLVIAQALLGGWRRAAPVTFAPLLADIPIAITLVFAVSQVPEGFLRFIKFAGAALLAYLAWGLWQEIRKRHEAKQEQAAAPQSIWRGLAQGTMMLFLSPGSYLFWGLVLGPLLLEALDHSLTHGVAFVLSFYIFSIGGLLAIAYVIGRIGQLSPRGRYYLQLGSLALMVVMSSLLLYNGLTS